MNHYFFRLLPPRPTFLQTITPEELALMGAHGEYWRGILQRGHVAGFGLVADPAAAYGVAIVELPEGEDPQALADNDPTILANVGFRMEILPMPRAVTRPFAPSA